MSTARERGARILSKLRAVDALLVAAGFPPISPWWWAELERFYLSGKMQFVLRVGRRGGKSSTLCRVAVVEALYGEHVVAPGDEGVFAIISTKLGEARKRLITVEEILRVLKVAVAPLGSNRNGIRITSKAGKPIAFEIFAGTVAGVSGFTAIGALCDEVAKWRDEDTGSNPATEVLRSLRPTLATTMTTAHLFLVSSPFSTLDAHYEAMKEGDTARQLVAEASTWITNPTITEDDTRVLEPDEATRLREYGAIPMSGGESFFFDHATVEAALVRAFDPRGARHATGVDPAFRGDSAGACTTGRLVELYGVRELLELTPRPGAPLIPGDVVDAMAAQAKRYGCKELVTDNHYPEAVREHAARLKLGCILSGGDKVGDYIATRGLFVRGVISLGDHPLAPKLARQLKETMAKPTPGGSLSIWVPRRAGSHGDLASAFVLSVVRLGAGKATRAPEASTLIRVGATRHAYRSRGGPRVSN